MFVGQPRPTSPRAWFYIRSRAVSDKAEFNTQQSPACASSKVVYDDKTCILDYTLSLGQHFTQPTRTRPVGLNCIPAMENATGKPLPGLLRLPPPIRRRIYIFSGLAPAHGRPYVFDLHGGCRDRRAPSPACWYGLLPSCRAIYTETAALLYSANHFLIYYLGPASLEPLRALNPPSLASLASLKVILNEASCHEPRECYASAACYSEPSSYCREFHAHLHRLPVPCPDSRTDGDRLAAAQAMLDEWHSTAAYLSSHIRPGRLSFSLVCDVDPQQEQGVELAKRATVSLHLLPLLETCQIRLCKTPHYGLQEVAHDAARKVCRLAAPYYRPSPTLTTFVTLPRELRLRILEYTDLITPWKEVSWSRQDRGYCLFRTGCVEGPEYRIAPDIHHGCQFSQCCPDENWSTRSPAGCFCRRRHAAFSTTCKCWAPPGPDLFLICRTLCRDAQLVFFSGNRFVIHDHSCARPVSVALEWKQVDPGDASTGAYPYDRLGASLFFRELVPIHCLAYLRFVELVFPPYQHHIWPQEEHPAIKDWRATVDWLQDKINARGLTLRLIMADPLPEDWEAVDRAFITIPQGNAILAAYRAILRPLKLVAAGDDGLAAFYASLTCPWQWTESVRDRLNQPGGQEEAPDKAQERKRDAQREVMGDRYESLYANGKTEPNWSIWGYAVYAYNQ